MDKKFPTFGQLFLWLLCAFIFAMIAVSASFLTDGARAVLWITTLAFSLAGVIWTVMLYKEHQHQIDLDEQRDQRDNLELVNRTWDRLSFLPTEQRLLAFHKIHPMLGMNEIHIPQEAAPQISTAPNESFEHRVNISKAEQAKLRAAAVEFNGKFSRNKLSPKYFTQPEYERIYNELTKESPNHVSYATKDGLNDSPILTDAGWQWLGIPPNTTLLDGFKAL